MFKIEGPHKHSLLDPEKVAAKGKEETEKTSTVTEQVDWGEKIR